MSKAKQYRKKPVVIEAVQWKYGPGDIELRSFLTEWVGDAFDTSGEYWYPGIKTLEGVMRVSPGDYIIKGVKGEFYPCKPDIFEATYELLSPDKETK